MKVKRIFAVTTLTSDNKGNQYVTERNQTAMKELEVPPSIAGNRRISVFVNPMSLNGNENSNDSMTEDDSMMAKRNSAPANPNAAAAEVLKNARRFKKPNFSKGSTGSLDESLFESVNSTATTTTPTTTTATAKTKNTRNSESTANDKLNGDVNSSSLDSITNSLASSSPEITATNKTAQVTLLYIII